MTTLAVQHLAPVNLTGYRFGAPQRSGALTVVPVFGPTYPGIAPPRTGVKLLRVPGYGQVVLGNHGSGGVAIVPLHIGYVQDTAQNHALCRSAFLAPGQELLFADACCVQQSQGGYLAERDQWFFVLPVELRAKALELRGVANYSKLWPAITAFNRRYRLPARGHLEQVLTRKRAVLTQFQSRLELLPEQVGALFFVGERFAGMEIAPDPRYFAELWMALVCFAYGPAAWHVEPAAVDAEPGPSTRDVELAAVGAEAGPSTRDVELAAVDAEPGPSTRDVEPAAVDAEPFDVDAAAGLDGIRAALAARRATVADQVAAWLAEAAREPADLTEEERFLDLRLSTVSGDALAGQVVTDGDRLVYASVFARETV